MNNITVDNSCPTINLWQQYRKNQVIVDYFTFLQSYIQMKYYNFLMTSCVPALSIINSFNDYVQYYALNILDIPIPVSISLGTKYDIGQQWDVGNIYDQTVGAVQISVPQFKAMLAMIFNWSTSNWDIPTLFKITSTFTGLNYSQINIVQDGSNADLFTITMTTNANTTLFKTLFLYYAPLLNLPFGISFNIVLT